MAYPAGTFKSSFWETDFVTLHGFETLVAHIKEGQKSCKWLEDFLKQRAKAEEEYGKTLAKMSKGTVDEFGTLRKVLEKLQSECEVEASLHLSTAAKCQEEAAKLEKFRERQKEDRKTKEEFLRKTHKFKAEAYRRMQNSKSTCENRFKAADKAVAENEKNKSALKQKDAEKARKQASQSMIAASKADDEYKAATGALEVARKKWEEDHVECCGVFQKLEEERIKFVRNSVWVFTNFVSELCCKLDDCEETIRLVAEQCDENADIREFVAQKATLTRPLPTIEYTPFGSAGPSSQSINPVQTGMTLPSTQTNGFQHVYEVGDEPTQMYTVLFPYAPAKNDEMEMKEGDIIKYISSTEESWITGLNMRTRKTGLVPVNYIELR